MAPNARQQNCDKCSKSINLRHKKHLFCEGVCGKIWHYPSCSNISAEEFEEVMKNPQKHWICDPCNTKRANRLSMVYPDRNLNDENAASGLTTPATGNFSSRILPKRNCKTNSESITLESIFDEIKLIQSKQDKFQRSLDVLQTTINDYKEIMDGLTEENIELKNQNEILHSRIDNIEYNMDNQQQQKLNKNIIINGVIEENDENTLDIVTKICESIEVIINANQIKSVHRMKTANVNSGFPSSIIVEFTDENIKKDIIKKKKNKSIKTQSIGINGEDRNIYISEHLTPRKQFLFKSARDIKRKNGIKYAWANDGDVFIRKSDTSRIIKLKNINQLNSFKNAVADE